MPKIAPNHSKNSSYYYKLELIFFVSHSLICQLSLKITSTSCYHKKDHSNVRECENYAFITFAKIVSYAKLSKYIGELKPPTFTNFYTYIYAFINTRMCKRYIFSSKIKCPNIDIYGGIIRKKES